MKKKKKYSQEDRIAITKYSYTAGKSVKEVAQEYGVDPMLLYNWRQLYGDMAGKHKKDFRIHKPASSLKAPEEKVSLPRKTINLTREQKAELVKKSYEFKGSLIEFCQQHKLDRALLYSWRKHSRNKDTKQKSMYLALAVLFLVVCFGMAVFYRCF